MSFTRPKGAGGFRSPAQLQLDESRFHMERQSVFRTIRKLLWKAAMFTTGWAKKKALKLADFLSEQIA